MSNVVNINIPIASIFPTAPSFDVCLAECVAVIGEPSQVRDFRDIGKGRDAWWIGPDGGASYVVLHGDETCSLKAHCGGVRPTSMTAEWILDPAPSGDFAKRMRQFHPDVLIASPADAARAAALFIGR